MCHFGCLTPCDLEHRILRHNQINFASLYLFILHTSYYLSDTSTYAILPVRNEHIRHIACPLQYIRLITCLLRYTYAKLPPYIDIFRYNSEMVQILFFLLCQYNCCGILRRVDLIQLV